MGNPHIAPKNGGKSLEESFEVEYNFEVIRVGLDEATKRIWQATDEDHRLIATVEALNWVSMAIGRLSKEGR